MRWDLYDWLVLRSWRTLPQHLDVIRFVRRTLFSTCARVMYDNARRLSPRECNSSSSRDYNRCKWA